MEQLEFVLQIILIPHISLVTQNTQNNLYNYLAHYSQQSTERRKKECLKM